MFVSQAYPTYFSRAGLTLSDWLTNLSFEYAMSDRQAQP